jgi:N-acyl homoserine lactone hydrolase
VKVRAEATPLTGPLPGGAERSSVVVEPLEAGRAHFGRSFFEYEGRGDLGRLLAAARVSRSSLPVPAYLLSHPRAGAILVDTGLHPSVASDPSQNLGRVLGRYYRLEHGRDVPAQVRARGLDEGEIAVVILTHLHADHASAISEFPESTFVFSVEEWRHASTVARPWREGYRHQHYDHAFDYRTVDFDGETIDSYGSFGRSFDLLGDGSIRLAYTPGHTHGHLSVVCRLARRDFVIAGDAVATWRQLNGGPEPSQMADEHNWRRSLRELQAFHRSYPHAVIAPGHDQGFWEKLEDRYEE